jgi:acetyltransferase
MVTKEDLVFRQVVTLRDGARVLLRPLLPEDRQAMLDFFLPTPPEDRRFTRHNVNDPAVINSWMDRIEYEKVFPLIAVVKDRIVGEATLHFNEGPAKHRAELRIFLAKDFRKRGLGSKLIQAMIDLAKRRSLFIMECKVVAEQTELIKAMQRAGFKSVCVFEDFYMLPDNELRDVVYLVLRLRTAEDEF